MNLWINLAASLSLVLLYTGTSQSLEYIELKPRIKEQLRAVGDSFFITCLSIKQENVDLYNIKWKLPSGDTVTNHGRVHIDKTAEGIELVFSKVSEEDGGEYTCTAETSEGKIVENSFRLEVYKKIFFDEAPREQIAEEEKDFLLKCRVSGLPKPKINWKADGDVLKTGEKYKYVDEGLLIYKVTREDAKEYECKALQISNTTSAFDLRLITLKVSYIPVWKSESYISEYFSWIGGTVTLTCTAEGIPTPEIKWLKEQILIESITSSVTNTHEISSTLKIEVINKASYGQYICQAGNTIGNIERIYNLNEAVKLDAPTVSGESHSMNSIHLDIQAPGKTYGLEIKGYKVCYITGNQKWDDSAVIEFNSSSTDYILRSLKPGTTYKIRAAAKTEIGYGKVSTDFIIATRVGGMTSTRSGKTSSASCIAVNLDMILSTLVAIVNLIVFR